MSRTKKTGTTAGPMMPHQFPQSARWPVGPRETTTEREGLYEYFVIAVDKTGLVAYAGFVSHFLAGK